MDFITCVHVINMRVPVPEWIIKIAIRTKHWVMYKKKAFFARHCVQHGEWILVLQRNAMRLSAGKIVKAWNCSAHHRHEWALHWTFYVTWGMGWYAGPIKKSNGRQKEGLWMRARHLHHPDVFAVRRLRKNRVSYACLFFSNYFPSLRWGLYKLIFLSLLRLAIALSFVCVKWPFYVWFRKCSRPKRCNNVTFRRLLL